MSNWLQSDKLSNFWSEKWAFKTLTTFPSSTACSRRVWPWKKKKKKRTLTHCFAVKQHGLPSLRDLTWWEWGVYICRLVQKGHQAECLSWPFHQQLRGHEAHHVSDVDRKWDQMSLDLLLDILPCCLALDGTGMLLNSFTSLTLADRRKQWWRLILTSHILTIWCRLSEMLLTSCLSWVWRYMVSAFHCAEEWTSSGDTWEGMQSGPVGSECLESGRKNVCGKVYKELLSLF